MQPIEIAGVIECLQCKKQIVFAKMPELSGLEYFAVKLPSGACGTNCVKRRADFGGEKIKISYRKETNIF